MNSKNNSSLVCLLLVLIIFVLGSTKLERAAGHGNRGASVCNGTIGECATGDEVELLLMHSPSRLLAGSNGNSIVYPVLGSDSPITCNAKGTKKAYANCIELQDKKSRTGRSNLCGGTMPAFCNKGSG